MIKILSNEYIHNKCIHIYAHTSPGKENLAYEIYFEGYTSFSVVLTIYRQIKNKIRMFDLKIVSRENILVMTQKFPLNFF